MSWEESCSSKEGGEMNIRENCPICGKDIAVSLYGIIHRHNNNTSNTMCPASGRYFSNVKQEVKKEKKDGS